MRSRREEKRRVGIKLRKWAWGQATGTQAKSTPWEPAKDSAASLAAENSVVVCFFGSFTPAPDSGAKLSHVPTSFGWGVSSGFFFSSLKGNRCCRVLLHTNSLTFLKHGKAFQAQKSLGSGRCPFQRHPWVYGLFFDRVSLHSQGWPGTHSLSAPAFLVLR